MVAFSMCLQVDGGTRRSPGTYLQEVEAKAAILKSSQLQKPAKPARLPQTAQATPEGDEQEQQRAEQRRQQQQQQQQQPQPPPASPAGSADPSTAPPPQRDHASVSRKPKQSASSPPTTTQSSPPHHPHDAGQDGATPSAESAVASAQRPSSRRSSARAASTAASPSSSLPSPHTQRAATESAGEALHLMESVWEIITILASCHEPRGPLGPPRISRLHFSMAGPTQGRAKISKHQQVSPTQWPVVWHFES